jgi:large subunit ribosomal protein L9
MKVILLTDVKGRGNEGDVIEVARGFGVNYLLPRKMAAEATPGNIKQLEARMHNIRKREVGRHTDAEGIAASVNGKTLVIEAKAGDTGKLFGSITAGAVAEALIAQLGVDIDRRKIGVHGHIKTLGEFPVVIHLYQDVTAEIVVTVVREGGAAEAVATAAAPVAAEVTEVSPDADETVDEVEAVEETADTDEVEEPDEDEAEDDDDSDDDADEDEDK